MNNRFRTVEAAPGGDWDSPPQAGPTIDEMIKAGTLVDHRPRKAHVETAGAPVEAAPLQLTDWIPCTTPPVRDGDYEMEYIGSGLIFGARSWRAEFRAGVWRGVEFFPGDELTAVTGNPADYQWRGRRMWVLTVPSLCGCRVDHVVEVTKRGVLQAVAELYNEHFRTSPMAFDTEADAVAYATKHAKRLAGWKAVLA